MQFRHPLDAVRHLGNAIRTVHRVAELLTKEAHRMATMCAILNYSQAERQTKVEQIKVRIALKQLEVGQFLLFTEQCSAVNCLMMCNARRYLDAFDCSRGC